MAYAHTPDSSGRWHDLEAHLRAVAERASEFAGAFEAGELGYYLGLWHDLGKFNPGFQQYLLACQAGSGLRRGPDHKAAGVDTSRRHGLGLVALPLQGHHGGLKTPTHFQKWFADCTRDPAMQQALTLAHRTLPDLDPPSQLNPPSHATEGPLGAELFLRMLFSALVDADHLDTEAHFRADKAARRGTPIGLEELWERFETGRRAVTGKGSDAVREVRREVYDACVAAAEQPPGLFRLSVPTGGGKTLSGMAFALRHALRHGLRRVVVAVPYISITEQTARAYREVFGEPEGSATPVVLEHHSGAGGDADEQGDYRPAHVWARLAAENWDAPVVVTTTVQLFESLFSNGTSPCRKLHRLAKSVIVLDEAQALPSHLLSPTLDALRRLCDDYGASVIVSTATQPAFEEIPEFARLPAREIVPDPARHFRALRRVSYEWRTDRPMEWAEVAALMRDEGQALAVLNTKADALALLDALDDPGALHLSTSLCGVHRRDVIEAVRQRLDRGEPCRLVSTQVIEAGVDLDFPLVLRALGPLDGVIQAAGRCNREGRLERGRVIVFDPAEGGLPPGAYRTGTQSTQTLLGGAPPAPDDPSTAREYFRDLFRLLSTDARGIQELRERFEYPEVRSRYRLIEEETESAIITEYGTDEQRAAVRRRIEDLQANPSSARLALRRLQPYTVAVRTRVAEEYRREGLLSPLLPDMGVGEWHGAYDSVRGLLAKDRSPEGLIV